MNEKEARATFNHKEAYCIMTYRCKSCGFEERIWNSRDGVTPFCIACPSCGKPDHYHEDWHNDRYAPFHLIFMEKGQRYFVNMTMERAREYAAKRVDHYIEIGELAAGSRNYVIGEVAKSFYHGGDAPDIMVHK